jgi:hypothetical protein
VAGGVAGDGMTLTIEAEGQASKRGMIPRLPAPDRLLDDARAWIDTEYAGVVRSAVVQLDGESAVLRLELHPAASPVTITADAEGQVTVAGETSSAGPGYHTFLGRLVERLGDAVSILWTLPAASGAPGTTTTWVGSRQPLAERPVVERDHLLGLRGDLMRAIEQRRLGLKGIPVGLRAGTRFEVETAIATPLGPRDDAWLARVAPDVRGAIDIRPWWLDVMDARYQLARALVILWTEIRWRSPADEAERATMDEALGLLRRALPADPSLPYPWREWAELMQLRAVPDPRADRVFDMAARVDPAEPLIGYRRRPVTVVHEGWSLPVPGTFSELRVDGEWKGGDRGRQVTIAATRTQGPDGRPMPAERFLSEVAGDLGEGTLRHEDGGLRGRARVTTDASSGVEVAVLEGFSAVTGSGAAIRVEFDDSDDWRWAIDLWRSLRPA